MQTTDGLCASQKILSVQESELAQFVRDEIREKRLSATMEQLNAQLLSTDHTAREMAEQAITRLGFMVDS